MEISPNIFRWDAACPRARLRPGPGENPDFDSLFTVNIPVGVNQPPNCPFNQHARHRAIDFSEHVELETLEENYPVAFY
jgi:hypothetical protein